jgi:hypothetical protein
MDQGSPHNNVAFSGLAQYELLRFLSGLEGSRSAFKVLLIVSRRVWFHISKLIFTTVTVP